ncbi:hypothetical protein SNARM312S_01327 [Streptomyces narbonensis]
MTTSAPTAEPLVKPMMSGLPRGLPVMLCRMAPLTARAAPTQSAVRSRGMRRVLTTKSAMPEPLPVSASTTSPTVRSKSPVVRVMPATARSAARRAAVTATVRPRTSRETAPEGVRRTRPLTTRDGAGAESEAVADPSPEPGGGPEAFASRTAVTA